jgi:hypothetical protein
MTVPRETLQDFMKFNPSVGSKFIPWTHSLLHLAHTEDIDMDIIRDIPHLSPPFPHIVEHIGATPAHHPPFTCEPLYAY